MSSRASLNKVMLIGNLTRDPELRYTPSGAAVCTFGVATNRTYTASDGTKKEEAEFIKIVAWNKLGELCSQLLAKGRKVYVEGRLQTRSWETADGQNRQTTEVIIDDMRILDSKKSYEESSGSYDVQYEEPKETTSNQEGKELVGEESTKKGSGETKAENKGKKDTKAKGEAKPSSDDIDLDDLPF